MPGSQARPQNPAHARKRARRLAMQALYQWQLSGHSLKDVDAQFQDDEDMPRADGQYFRELLHKIPARLDEVDDTLAPWLDRSVEQLDPVERAILRIAVYELLFRIDIPYRVVINEAVALAKTFGAAEGYKYVNGVLDQAARALRSADQPRSPGQ